MFNCLTSTPKLSQRAQNALDRAGAFVKITDELSHNAYSHSNPHGFCNLGVAENTLHHEELVKYYNTKFELTDVDLTYGTDLSGSMRLSKAMATFLNKHFSPAVPIKPEHLVAGAGCSAVVDMLAFHVGDPGDGILIPTPYYSGYNSDLSTRSGIKAVPVAVDQTDPLGIHTMKTFEETMQKAQSGGTRIRALILCNPHNPLGRCYPRETILEYARFCEKHNIHLISDEIYAFSVFPTWDNTEPIPFISVLSIDFAKEAGCNPARVHVVYGLSKDFSANGLRGGVLVSPHNAGMVLAMRSTSLYMKMSTATAMLWSVILEDDEFFANYIKENRRRLRHAYEFLTSWFKFHKIPYNPSNAGHFVMADFRQFFPEKDKEGDVLPTTVDDNGTARDQNLYQRIMDSKVYVGSGVAFCHPIPGWYRITFSLRRDYLVVGLARLEKTFGLPSFPGLSEPSSTVAKAEASVAAVKVRVEEAKQKLKLRESKTGEVDKRRGLSRTVALA